MAVIAMATADLQDLNVFSALNSCTISDVQARTGSYSYRTALSFGYWNLQIPASSEFYCRFALFRPPGNVNILFTAADVTQCSVTFTANNIQANYRLTGTLLGSVLGPFTPYIWNVYEIYVKIHISDGIITVKQNGVQILNVTGRTNHASATIDAIRGNNPISQTNYWDDILIDDANWPGLGGIEVIKPSADGTDLAWDSGTYADVIDDDDATYVATDAEVTAKQSFTIPALAADRKTPTVVCLLTKSQLSGAGAGTLRPYLDANQGQSVALSTGLQYTQDYQVAYPTEVGLEVVV